MNEINIRIKIVVVIFTAMKTQTHLIRTPRQNLMSAYRTELCHNQCRSLGARTFEDTDGHDKVIFCSGLYKLTVTESKPH
jgi:hypothetical protein